MATRNRTAKRYATVAEVADYTGLSEGTIRNLLSTRELTAFRPVAGRVVLDLREVERFVRDSTKAVWKNYFSLSSIRCAAKWCSSTWVAPSVVSI